MGAKNKLGMQKPVLALSITHSITEDAINDKKIDG